MMHFSEIQRADLIDRIRRLSRPLHPRATGERPRIEPRPAVRAVLFDVYGTLLISAAGDIGTGEHGAREHVLEAAAAAGIALPNDPAIDWFARFHDAVRQRHAARRAEGVACPEVDVRHIWRSVLESAGTGGSEEALLRFALEVECRINPVWPMPGAREAIRRLAERGIALGIVSNAQCFTPLLFDALLGESIEGMGFTPAFCAWSWQLGEAKPSPRVLRHALDALAAQRGIHPDDVLFVGNDMLNDLHPAARAGCRTALFAGDARSLRTRGSDPRCADLRPDLVLTSFDPDFIA